jgi:hypothetical protein
MVRASSWTRDLVVTCGLLLVLLPALASGADTAIDVEGGTACGAQPQPCFGSLHAQCRGAEGRMRQGAALSAISVVVMIVGERGPCA